MNNDKVIEISFGDVPIEEIDGIDSYYQPVPLTVTCSGSASTSVSIAIRGNVTPWDRNSIVTSTDGLGIRHWIHVPGLYMDPAPTGGFNIVALNDIPTLIIHAVLNKQSGKTLTPQEFSATATLLVNYE
ncbi:fimbrial protein [Enterobacter ludwigii]|uniref:fimbrial protein n=1 Tax=Enterobacter ludwigii TaxID=299767 RepID=UPI00159CBDE9|nr:fimbrial protein [Enterobacter ludwigii]QLA06940.1 fimbrial protein [Enterobacter ludwigii]